MEAGIAKGHTGKFFDGFVLVLAEGYALLEDAIIFEAGIKVARVAAHVADQIEHP